MENVLLVILLLLALALIGVVLLQRSEGGGLGMGGGSGGGGVMSARGAATALTRLTWILGIAFLAASLALTIISAEKSADTSVTDLIPSTSQENTEEVPQNPGVPDVTDMMPPTTGSDTPAAPPRAE